MSFQETLTPDERLRSLYDTGCADRPGVYAFALGMIPKMHYGMTIGECYADPLLYAKAYIRIWQLFKFDTGPLFGHACEGNAEFGGTLAYPGKHSKAHSPFIVNRAVKTPEDVDLLPIPDPKEVGEIPKIIEACKYVQREYPKGYRSPTIIIGTPLTWVANLAGIETVLTWLIESPELVVKLLKKVVQFQIEYSKFIVEELGPIEIFQGSLAESNDFISAKQFECYALPYLTEFNNKADQNGIFGINTHPCGDQTKNLKLWKKVPNIRSINFDYRTPLIDVVNEFDRQSMVVGNIESNFFITHDYESIYSKANEFLKLAATKCAHGYLVGPGCEMPHSVSPANIYAMIQAARDYAETEEWMEHCRK